MTTSNVPTATAAAARKVRVTDRALVVELRDGRVVSVPLVKRVRACAVAEAIG